MASAVSTQPTSIGPGGPSGVKRASGRKRQRDSDDDGAGKPKRVRKSVLRAYGSKTPTGSAPPRCTYCIGADLPCDVGQRAVGAHPNANAPRWLFECRQCTLARDAGTVGPIHRCIVINSNDQEVYYEPDYYEQSVRDYNNAICGPCEAEASLAESGPRASAERARRIRSRCDIDPLLGIKCSRCTIGESGRGNQGATARPRRECTWEGTEMLVRAKPSLGMGIWFRTGCTSCINKDAECSWLERKDSKTGSCSRCATIGISCSNNSDRRHYPRATITPASWHIDTQREEGVEECRKSLGPRRECQSCTQISNAHCRLRSENPEAACVRCTQWGIRCMVKDPATQTYTECPIYDLRDVGFGMLMAFKSCSRCTELNLKCDRQRPCDNCHSVDEATAAACRAETWGPNTAPRGFGAEEDRPQDPLYYLALGCGVGGTRTTRDAGRLYSWIGPPGPIWQYTDEDLAEGRDMRKFLEGIVRQWRNVVVPQTRPPHTIHDATRPGYPTSYQLKPSLLTPEEIDRILTDIPAGAQIQRPNQHPEWHNAITGLGNRVPPRAQNIAAQNPPAVQNAPAGPAAPPASPVAATGVPAPAPPNNPQAATHGVSPGASALGPTAIAHSTAPPDQISESSEPSPISPSSQPSRNSEGLSEIHPYLLYLSGINIDNLQPSNVPAQAIPAVSDQQPGEHLLAPVQEPAAASSLAQSEEGSRDNRDDYQPEAYYPPSPKMFY